MILRHEIRVRISLAPVRSFAFPRLIGDRVSLAVYSGTVARFLSFLSVFNSIIFRFAVCICLLKNSSVMSSVTSSTVA